MKPARRSLLLLLVLFSACRDHATDPDRRVASIRLSESAAAVDDGATLQLTTELLDRAGRALPSGSVRLAWSSSDEAVATVAEGLVTGRRPGQARITATVRQVSASAQVTVRAVPQQLAAASGAAQEGVAGTAAPQELVALLTDRHGGGVPGATVEFVVVRGGGTVTPASMQTDAQGRARAAWTLGKAMGENVVEARVAGRSLAPAVFAAMGRAGLPARLEKTAGDGQEAPAATQLPLPLVARVLDANGNPVAGASVAWRATHDGSVAPPVSMSDAAGEARATWLVGPAAGEHGAEAWVDGVTGARVQFSARVGVGAAARLEKVRGEGQEVVVTQPLPEPLVVRAVDAPGNPVPGVKVSWTLGYGGGTVAPPESVTDSQGYARATWTLGTIMATHRLEARAPELPAASAVFTARALVGPATSVGKHRGDGQEGEVGHALSAPLVLRVTDAHGNPVAGVQVQWEGMGTMQTAVVVTDMLGLARGTWVLGTRAGTQTMSATAAGKAVSFAAVASMGLPAAIRLDPDLAMLLVGETLQVKPTVADRFGNEGDGEGLALNWSSSDPAVVAVSASGLVTAVGPGSATITATRDGVSGSARLSVSDRIASFTELGTLGGPSSRAYAINEDGVVVGVSATASGREHAFLWRSGVMVDLGTLGGESSVATAINDAGLVVGYGLTAGGDTHAFLWGNGTMTDLGTLGGRESRARGVNAAGQVVGSSTTTAGQEHAFVWKDGVMTDLGTLGGSSGGASAIDDAGRVVGWRWLRLTDAVMPDAVIWKDGVLTGLAAPDIPMSYGHAINGAELVVGESWSGFQIHAVLWRGGVVTRLVRGSARAVNAAGQVVGDSWGGPRNHAFIWEDGQVTDLGTLGGTSGGASGINDAGQVVGWRVRSIGGAEHFRAVLLTIR